MAYATGTDVSVDRSRAEIERTLKRYGATAFAYGWSGSAAQVEFVAHNRRIRFKLFLPDPEDDQFVYARVNQTSARTRRKPAEAEKVWEQACRSRWRSLLLVIKAKLEAVEAGITTFEDEFLASVVLPDGATAGEWMQPQIARAYEMNRMPPLLSLEVG